MVGLKCLVIQGAKLHLAGWKRAVSHAFIGVFRCFLSPRNSGYTLVSYGILGSVCVCVFCLFVCVYVFFLLVCLCVCVCVCVCLCVYKAFF
jgi:hypothetical protein